MKISESLVLCSVLAVLALPLAGLVNTAAAQGILVNPDFETGDLTGWLVTGETEGVSASVQSGDNGPALPGSNNAFLSNNLAAAISLTMKQTTPVGSIEAGEITYSFDLKLDQADVGGVLFVEIFAEQSGVGIVGGSGLLGPFWPWNEWSTFTGSFMAPEGADFLTVQIMANTGAAEGSNCIAHVDNVIIAGEGTVADEASSLDQVKALYR